MRSVEELAELVLSVAKAARADSVLCATETGELMRQLVERSKGAGSAETTRLLAATSHEAAFEALNAEKIAVFRLPVHVAEPYRQVPLIIAVAFRAGLVSNGQLVVCAIGDETSATASDLIVLTDVDEAAEAIGLRDLVKLTDGIRPRVIEAAVSVACRVGRAAGRGKHVGAIFMLGDSIEVLKGARQLIPNPFKGHDHDGRMITNPAIHEALVELAKLDGAFVLRGDGFIQTAGVFLAAERAEVSLPSGLGARHVAAAAATARSKATAVVVSATDGNVRLFSEGRLVLQIAPDVPHGPVSFDD